MMNRTILLLCLALAALLAAPAAAASDTQAASPGLPDDLRRELEASFRRGLAFLEREQKEDGSWESEPGITALAATAVLKSPVEVPDSLRAGVDKTLEYLAALAKPDGGIYVRDMPNYYTAVAMQAFIAADRPEYAGLVERAQGFLVDLQVDDGEGYDPDHKFFGGIGYGSDLRPDLANLEYALSALKESALPADHPLWDKALKFIQRTQNRSESNDQEWAANDGGFVYYPGFSYAEAGGTQSFGSMTYAGLMSYSHADLERDDPRVQAALEWISRHYTVDENPGMGLKTLYYYYLVFAKALAAWDRPIIYDADGVAHDWRRDLGRKLLAEQHEEGYWVNEDPSWWQDNKVLVTAFTLQALTHVLAE